MTDRYQRLITLIQGHALEVLPLLDEGSVQCVVTSPPYWGLRDYGLPAMVWGDWRGSLGLEPTPELYIEHLVSVFREVRRVLRGDGIFFLNLGDTFASQGGHAGQGKSSQRKGRGSVDIQNERPCMVPPSLKPKDLIGIPWRVALALQADGWWLRSDIIWSKPNPMPESATDRPAKAHEYVFLLTKSGSTTFWTHRDLPGVRSSPPPDYRWTDTLTGEETSIEPVGWGDETLGDGEAKRWRRVNLWRGHDYFWDAEAVREPHSGDWGGPRPNPGYYQDDGTPLQTAAGQGAKTLHVGHPAGRNIRSVWTIPTAPFPEAHFATFPPKLVEPMIKAGTSERGCCGECGAPWVRVVERPPVPRINRPAPKAQLLDNDSMAAAVRQGGDYLNGPELEEWRANNPPVVTWQPTCDHGGEPIPCTVLDPFCGSGTVGEVCLRLNRQFVGIDLSEPYLEMSERRIKASWDKYTDKAAIEIKRIMRNQSEDNS